MNQRAWSLTCGFLGLFLLFFSLTGSSITGNIIGIDVHGVNMASKIIGGIGILLMIASVIIENYEFKHLSFSRNKKKISKNK